MKKGVLIIAVGHKNYLGMAINLIASIKVNDPSLQIALATDVPPPGWLHEKGLVDINVHVPKEMITHNGDQAYIKSKLFMLELSPFDATIYLDADQIMITNRSLLPIFDQLAGVDFSSANWGLSEETLWAEMAEIRKVYGTEPFWNYHAEFMFFRKTKEVRAFFKAAQKVFRDNKLKTAFRFSGAAMADELAFGIASMQTGVKPHQVEWWPGFWFSRDQKNSRRNPYELLEYVTYSMAGKYAPNAVRTHYQNLANHYFRVLGLRHPYQHQDKATFLTNRKQA